MLKLQFFKNNLLYEHPCLQVADLELFGLFFIFCTVFAKFHARVIPTNLLNLWIYFDIKNDQKF